MVKARNGCILGVHRSVSILAAMLVASVCGSGPVLRLASAETVSTPADCEIDWRVNPGPIGASDVAALRDIPAASTNFLEAASVRPSPDGAMAAVQIMQAFPSENRYCSSWFLLSLDRPDQRLRFAGDGGAPLLHIDRRNPAYQSGFFRPAAPIWSADGTWFAYLRRDGSSVQVWRSWADGSGSERVSLTSLAVDTFIVDDTNNRILFETIEGVRPEDVLQEGEIRSGFLFNERFRPMLGPRPRPQPRDVRTQIWVHDWTTGIERLATRAEEEQFRAWDHRDLPVGHRAIGSVARSAGGSAWFETLKVDQPAGYAELILRAVSRSNAVHTCTARQCAGRLSGAWWRRSGTEVLFLRSEGRNGEERAIYAWRPGASAVREILRTTDILLGCQPTARGALCIEESALQPRRLVLLNETTGARTPIFDPNPGFGGRFKGAVQRLRWETPEAGFAFADLVLPPGQQPSNRHALIVIPYTGGGFLRGGGLGDEYPIIPLAEQGFAVLYVGVANERFRHAMQTGQESVETPSGIWPVKLAVKRWHFLSVQEGVRAVEALGVVDSRRIGIAGFSAGADATNYGLIHAPGRFAAVITTGWAWDPGVYYYATWPRTAVAPAGEPGPMELWQQISPALNVASISAPWLMNAPDSEYLAGLHTYIALRDAGRPVELHVLPNEAHIINQPAHRLAVYQRNIEWFKFWLHGVEDTDPAKRGQYERWRAMRERQCKSFSGEDSAAPWYCER